MPTQDDQNNLNQNNPNPQPPVTPVIPSSDDIPSLPPDFQNVSPQAGSSAPINLPPVISSPPQKKFGTGKIIATILGILLLVGGVGAGIVLTQQSQIFQGKAMDKTCNDSSTGPCPGKQSGDIIDKCSSGNDNGDPSDDKSKGCFGSGPHPTCVYEERIDVGACDIGGPTDQPGSSVSCVFDHYKDKQICVRVDGKWQRCDTNPVGELGIANDCTYTSTGDHGDSDCTTSGYGNCSRGNYCLSNTPCTPSVPPTSNCKPDDSCGGDEGTPPPKGTAECKNIKAYSTDWKLIADADLPKLKAGDKVNFCVKGSATVGSFDKARFMINGNLKPITTTKRPGSEDFCQDFTIPANKNSFNVKAMIHHVTLNWK